MMICIKSNYLSWSGASIKFKRCLRSDSKMFMSFIMEPESKEPNKTDPRQVKVLKTVLLNKTDHKHQVC